MIVKKYLLLMVNYNQSLLVTNTFKSLMNIVQHGINFDVFIWDNLAYEGNRELVDSVCLNFDIKYHASVENISLSKVYNKVVNDNCDDYEYLIIFDNDSVFTQDFFYSHTEAEKECGNTTKLYLPKVYDGVDLVSPGLLLGCFGRNLPDIEHGLQSVKNFTAINSGMIVKMSFFDKFKYDERINFYGTDDDFCINYRNTEDNYYVMNYALKHELSKNDESESVAKKRWRLNDNLNGIYYNNSGTVWFPISILYIIYIKVIFEIKL